MNKTATFDLTEPLTQVVVVTDTDPLYRPATDELRDVIRAAEPGEPVAAFDFDTNLTVTGVAGRFNGRPAILEPYLYFSGDDMTAVAIARRIPGYPVPTAGLGLIPGLGDPGFLDG